MKRFWLILPLAAFVPIGGGHFTTLPATPIGITFNPPAPSISDQFIANAQVANINVAMSDGTAFAGMLGFSPPTSTSCAQNGTGAGLFSEQQLPPLLLTTRPGTSADDGTKLVTVTATQME